MEFDEYEYLEKAVEETNGVPSSKDGNPREKSEKGYRRKDRSEEGDEFHEEKENRKSSKKSQSEDNGRERERDWDRDRDRGRDRDRDRERSSRHRSREQDLEKDKRSSRDKEKERRERDRDSERVKERESERRSRSHSRLERERGERERRSRSQSRLERERRSRSRSRIERERRSRSRSRLERERRSRSQSRLDRERERDLLREREESRRYKNKKEVAEPEADPERDQRTVFAYQMLLKATERDVFYFFSKAGKVCADKDTNFVVINQKGIDPPSLDILKFKLVLIRNMIFTCFLETSLMLIIYNVGGTHLGSLCSHLQVQDLGWLLKGTMRRRTYPF